MNNHNQENKGLWGWQLVQVTVGLSLLYFAQLYYFGAFDEETTRQAIRISARVAAILFSFAYMASSLQYFSKNVFTWWLRMNRKYVGISFAIIHLIHLCFLLILQQNFHPVFFKAKTISLIGGGMAYFFVVAMLLTSFDYFSKHLSPKQWKLLHTVGGAWIWYIFIRSYVKRAMTESEYIPMVVLLVVAVLLRIARNYRRKYGVKTFQKK